jgi:hypothetical protein
MFQDVNPAFFSPPWHSLSRSKWYQMVPAVSDWHPSKQPLHSQGRTTAADEGCGCGAQESCQCVWPPGWEMPSSRHTNGWNLGCVPSVPTQLIIYIDVSPVISYGCIWLYMVVSVGTWESSIGFMGVPHWRTFRGGPSPRSSFLGMEVRGTQKWADSGTGEIRIW